MWSSHRSHGVQSAVLYLASQGNAFDGGDFVFLDTEKGTPADAPAQDAPPSVTTTPYAPQAGRALVFSSGWENVHYVDRVTAGTRFAMPVFFGTAPPGTEDATAVEEEADDSTLESVDDDDGDDDNDEEYEWEPDACIRQLCEYWSSPTFTTAVSDETITGGRAAHTLAAAPHLPLAPAAWLGGMRSWMSGGSSSA